MDDKPLCGQYFGILNYAVGDTHSVRTKMTKSLPLSWQWTSTSSTLDSIRFTWSVPQHIYIERLENGETMALFSTSHRHFSTYLISFKRILIQKSWEVNLTGAHEQQVKATVTTSGSSAGSPTWVCLSLTSFTTAALQHMAVLPLMLRHCLHLGPTTSLPSWACSWNLQHFGCLHYLHFTRALPVWHSHQVFFFKGLASKLLLP
jgi:hypothetical protein